MEIRFFSVFLLAALLRTNVYATDGRSDSADILSYSINLNIISIQNKSIDGYTIIKVASKVNGLSGIRFDLLKLSTQKVWLSGQQQTYTANDSMLIINFSTVKNKGDTFDLKIEYS